MNRSLYYLVTLAFTLVTSICPAGDGKGLEGGAKKEGVTKEQVVSTINGDAVHVRGCYEKALEVSPTLTGKVAVKFSIDKEGIPTNCAIASSTIEQEGKKESHDKLTSCLIETCKAWKFPKPKNPMITHIAAFPFYFRPTTATAPAAAPARETASNSTSPQKK